MINLPLPNDKMQGRTVIASTWLNDDDENCLLALLIVLNGRSPYYTVSQIESMGGGIWQFVDPRNHMNINYGVEDFANSGGDA
jgi:hypothetical protein